MRYADGPTTQVHRQIAAHPRVVWALVCDITTPVGLSDELVEARWIDEDRFVGRSRHPVGGEWQTTCTVVAREPERLFGWVVGEPASPSAQWRFELEPAGGGTRLTQWVRLGPAASGLTPAIAAHPDKEERIVARRLEEHRANMERTVAGIAALAEGRTP